MALLCVTYFNSLFSYMFLRNESKRQRCHNTKIKPECKAKTVYT